jgi:spermidine/putrescine transport system substrate-binding protein
MNFMMEGKNSAELTNLIGSGNPNLDAMKSIKPEIARNTAIFPDKASLSKLEMLKDLDSKKRRARNKIWTEIRAS